ncbi:HAMP domain-containing protein [Paenibacillus lautus]|uniref:sensor histidine kinase n=1 Tax=Paenibacillus lautus TaxID=1401 RepID=UPI002DB647A0|nr:HAMP domain-containing protein [Paenibacillus lautus]MEC0206939.1 HAMP domain-containing protein [Paenibacillus lautus]
MGIVVALSVSFSLSRSIIVLQRLMKQVEIGNIDVHAPENKRGEIGYLYRRFNAMVNEINNLILTVTALQVKEKEMELKQLDSKMQVSGDKNIVPLRVAIIAAFSFYRYKFLSRVEDKNLYRLP